MHQDGGWHNLEFFIFFKWKEEHKITEFSGHYTADDGRVEKSRALKICYFIRYLSSFSSFIIFNAF